ncbi:MAG: hypothetical protein KA515_00055 [Candidatus Pacebacteria bacterium]|nr:hypothetical protein [Candidatus Paceibacterota bacterium]
MKKQFKYFAFILISSFVFSFFVLIPPKNVSAIALCSEIGYPSISIDIPGNPASMPLSNFKFYVYTYAEPSSPNYISFPDNYNTYPGPNSEGREYTYLVSSGNGSIEVFVEQNCEGPSPLPLPLTAARTVNINFAASPEVNGSCASSHYTCNAGNSTNTNNGTNSYTWTCAGTNGGSDASCSQAKVTPTVSISADPSSVISGGRTELSWSSTNADGCTATSGLPAFYGQGVPPASSTTAYPTSTTTYRITCYNDGSGASAWAETTVTVSANPMSGTLTPASQGCTLASGATTCNATLSWTTDNPVATSAVTNNGGATPASSSGNTGTNVVFAVPFNSNLGTNGVSLDGVTTFYLYNNAEKLKTATVTVCNTATPWNGTSCSNNLPVGSHDSATCTDAGGWALDWDAPNSPVTIQIFDGPYAANKVAVGEFSANLTRSDLNPGAGISKDHGFVWPIPLSLKDNTAHSLYAYAIDLQDGSRTALNLTPRAITCAPSPMTGALTATPLTCSIPSGGTSCNTTIDWSVVNPESATTKVTSSYPAPNTVVATGHTGSLSVPIHYNSRNLYLYNNEKLLATVTAYANCISGTAWINGSCTSVSAGLSVDLKLNGANHDTAAGAMNVLKGEVVQLSWDSFGHSSRTCSSSDGYSGDGWSNGSRPVSDSNVDITAANTNGSYEYTITCRQDSSLTAKDTNNFFSLLDLVKQVYAVTWSTVTDSAWVNVGVVAPKCGTNTSCVCEGSTCTITSGGTITIDWECPATSTTSVGVNFSTDTDNPPDGIGNPSGTVTFTPDLTKKYDVICNNDGGSGEVEVKVRKTPFFIEN